MEREAIWCCAKQRTAARRSLSLRREPAGLRRPAQARRATTPTMRRRFRRNLNLFQLSSYRRRHRDNRQIRKTVSSGRRASRSRSTTCWEAPRTRHKRCLRFRPTTPSPATRFQPRPWLRPFPASSTRQIQYLRAAQTSAAARPRIRTTSETERLRHQGQPRLQSRFISNCSRCGSNSSSNRDQAQAPRGKRVPKRLIVIRSRCSRKDIRAEGATHSCNRHLWETALSLDRANRRRSHPLSIHGVGVEAEGAKHRQANTVRHQDTHSQRCQHRQNQRQRTHHLPPPEAEPTARARGRVGRRSRPRIILMHPQNFSPVKSVRMY